MILWSEELKTMTMSATPGIMRRTRLTSKKKAILITVFYDSPDNNRSIKSPKNSTKETHFTSFIYYLLPLGSSTEASVLNTIACGCFIE